MNQKILVIEDDLDLSQLLKRFLTKNGYDVFNAHNGKKGIEIIEEIRPDLILCDFRLGDLDGAQIIQKAKEIDPNLPIIIITGYSDIRVAVHVMKMGAADYITKPLIPDEILITIRKVMERDSAQPSTGDQQKGDTDQSPRLRTYQKAIDYVFGESPQSLALFKQIDLVAPTNYSVIIYGESGAGKEAIAQTIHSRSNRSAHPFVAMDCGAISKELAGSELFGHEKGSFTGALATKIGHFELANGGTLFLDEVSNLPYEVQASLLRVVQERKVKRIGSTKEINLDVRIIIASNENLAEAYKKGRFREDLFHRFNEFHMTVAPLRERKEDIMVFAKYFLDQANRDLRKHITGFDKDVVDLFLNYPWYGNIREMKNVIKRAALLSEGDKIEAKSLPFEISNHSKLAFPEMVADPVATVVSEPAVKAERHTSLKTVALEAEYEMILDVLKKVNFNKSKAAEILNIDRKTLYNKMKSYNM
jgi:two-component system response regulator HydG